MSPDRMNMMPFARYDLSLFLSLAKTKDTSLMDSATFIILNIQLQTNGTEMEIKYTCIKVQINHKVQSCLTYELQRKKKMKQMILMSLITQCGIKAS